MNYYESKVLQDRESHLIGAGVTLFLLSPAFGLVAGVFLASAIAMYVTTGIVGLVGILSIGAAVHEKMERKQNL